MTFWVVRGALHGLLLEAFVGAGWEWTALASDLSHLAQRFPLTWRYQPSLTRQTPGPANVFSLSGPLILLLLQRGSPGSWLVFYFGKGARTLALLRKPQVCVPLFSPMGRARICRTQCSSQRPLFEFDSWVFIAVHRLLIAVTSFVEEPGFRSCGLLAQLLHNRHVEPPLLRDGIHVLCIGR